MSRWPKRILFFLLIVLVGLQFLQPEKNYQEPDDLQDTLDFIQSHPTIPERVQSVLQSSCYNCHSNTTEYDWYDFIQPGRWIVENHIQKGKKELNYNAWGRFTDRKKERLLRSMIEAIETHEMPLPSYLLLHPEARLSSEEADEVISWIKSQAP